MRTFILSLLALFLFSCEKSEYEAYLVTPGIEAVDSVAIYPNSPVLIADGKAKLTFLVKAFSKVQDRRVVEEVIDGKHIVKDSVFTVISDMKIDRLPADRIHIKTADGQIVENYIFSTAKGAGSDVEFFCTINNVKSAPCKVRLISRPEINFETVTIPVVFHLLCTDDNKAGFDGITDKMLQGFIDRANQVFAGSYANDPASVDSRIRFKLATENDKGKALETPGINRVKLGTPDRSEVTDYMNENLLWNPNKILNIWINDATNGIIAKRPAYVLDNGTSPAGFNLTPVISENEVEYTSYSGAGIALALNSVFSLNKAGSGKSEHLEYYLGVHFGLIPTVYNANSEYGFINGDTDYCSDTYTYLNGPISREKYTYSDNREAPVIYYNSYNIMDESSLSSSLTYEQALRIHTVITNCPGRMFK